MVVSAGGNILWTCDPDTILQFSKRSHDFTKPVEMMGMLNMYGPTITATEGEESRIYRRIAAPSFNDRTHCSAWTESLKQSSALLKRWASVKAPIMQLNEDVARLTLHVISYVCFDRQMEWPEATKVQNNPPKRHSMSYQEAISSMVDNVPILFIVPPPVLSISPFNVHKKAKASYTEWLKYMEEMRDETLESLLQNGSRKGASILESFVQAGQTSTRDPKGPEISPAAVLGNIFVFIMAGYETSANTLTYAIALLACRPDLQKAMQADLDVTLGERPSSNWSYEVDFPKLLDGYVGAVMDETLRLYSVLPFFPKTTRETPQSFTSNGRDYTVPPDTLILINTSAAHRNPKYWPAVVPTVGDGPPYPVSSFNPSRWLNQDKDSPAFSPTPGSYVPFSDGPRACMGKRFAQAQFCAVLATIFKEYSVELAVDDKQAADGRRVSKSLWEKTKRSAEKELSTGVGFLMSLKMTGKIPLRLVKRGQEQLVI
ncbi:MAG: hypothetical protein Q9163_004513 [Psora crenata]